MQRCEDFVNKTRVSEDYPDSFVNKVLIVQLVILGDVMLCKLCQFDQLRHDLLLLVRVCQVHQKGHNAVGNILKIKFKRITYLLIKKT
jgi:hypothetical protein